MSSATFSFGSLLNEVQILKGRTSSTSGIGIQHVFAGNAWFEIEGVVYISVLDHLH